MSETMEASLEKLQLAIHGISAPFWCAGACDPDKPVTLVLKGGFQFEVVRAKDDYEQESQVDPLVTRAKPAPFGIGKITRFDRTVRDALQIKAEKGELGVEGFDPESSGILNEIQRSLVPNAPGAITAELYALNVYSRSGHFAPHKDTPRGSDMFGTLVVCLPSQFYRGQLVLNHRGVVKKFDWGRAIKTQTKPNQLHWAAFFGDVDHQIERMWSGARITLTYLLRFASGGSPPQVGASEQELAPRVQEAWQALLQDPSFLPNGGTLAYPCCHLYHQDVRFQEEQHPITPQTAGMLKGRDQLVAGTALQAGLEVAFQPYLFENCGDEIWLMDRFPTKSEKSRMGSRLDPTRLERALPIRRNVAELRDSEVTWIDPPPETESVSPDADTKGDTGTAAAARLHSCEYSETGYFGNEGSEVDFYTYAALHIEIPRFGRGPRAAAKPAKRPQAKRTPAKPKTPSGKRKGKSEK